MMKIKPADHMKKKDLNIAVRWMRNEITLVEVQKHIQAKHLANSYHWLAPKIREAFRRGMLQ